MDQKQKEPCKAHVLVLPFPAQGHMNPIIEFSKRLVSRGIKATLAITKYLSKSIVADTNSPIGVDTISDGYDDSGYFAAESPEAYLSSFEAVGSKTLLELIKKLNSRDKKVTAIMYDSAIPWALDVGKRLGLVGVHFFTQSCAVSTVYYHVQRGLLPVPLSGPKVSLPGCGLPVLEAWETSSFICDYGSYPAFFDVVVNQFINIDDADWVLYSSFYELEKEVVDWLATRWRVATIGPTLPSMYLDKKLEYDKDYFMHFWKPDTTCMEWLQDKPNESVVYVSFGSLAELNEEQMGEMAWGLRQSNCYFLWVVRTPEEAKLPLNFKEEASDKGLVVNWCPQLDVLKHEAIGCFFTHCGFNSVLEAISLGVPIVGIPRWTDQPTNAKYVEEVWKVGIRARPDETGIVRREEVEKCVKEVIEGEKGKQIKENAKKWEELAKKAVDEGGTSDRCIDEFVASLISSN